VAGPTVWNGLSVALHLTPVGHSALGFFSGLKTRFLTKVSLGALPSRLLEWALFKTVVIIIKIINEYDEEGDDNSDDFVQERWAILI